MTLTPNTIYSFKVTARNSVGNSVLSTAVSIRAAKIPDAPINLANVPAITTAYQIGLSWTEGVYNGGSPVLDYQVEYKITTDATYTVYASGYTFTSITVTSLTPGVTYMFRVMDRNVVGSSGYSSTISILAA